MLRLLKLKRLKHLRKFAAGIILAADKSKGNLLGEYLLRCPDEFDLIKNRQGTWSPFLKRGSTGVVWDDVSEHFGVPKIVAMSLLGNAYENWWQIKYVKGISSPLELESARDDITNCCNYWLYKGFKDTSLPKNNKFDVQKRNIEWYLSLSSAEKKDLISITYILIYNDE